MVSSQRLDFHDQDAFEAMMGLERYVHAGDLPEGLLALVKMRASQLNGCAWCLDMHVGEARKAKISQRKLDLLATWREAGTLFDAAERAALGLAESVTLISEAGVPDPVWDEASAVFNSDDLTRLLMAIGAINVWNRLNVATRTELPGQPVPPAPVA